MNGGWPPKVQVSPVLQIFTTGNLLVTLGLDAFVFACFDVFPVAIVKGTCSHIERERMSKNRTLVLSCIRQRERKQQQQSNSQW